VSRLTRRRCHPLPAGTAPLPASAIARLLAEIPGWRRRGKAIFREFRFSGYAETIAFANAVAWIAQREDHHPDMMIGFNRCRIKYSTHSIRGISMNDLICAAKINALLDGEPSTAR
jgi:4a-hydroxytetrahydrobiopterin dehydratase